MSNVSKLKQKAEVVELTKRESLDLLSWVNRLGSLRVQCEHAEQMLDLMNASVREKYQVNEEWVCDIREGILKPPKDSGNGE